MAAAVRASQAMEAPAGAGDSALATFLSRTVVHERAATLIPRDLLGFGLLGSLAVVATALLALALPRPDSIRGGDLFLLFGGIAADLDALMRALAVPALACGLALLALDLWLMRGLHAQRWRTVVVIQAAAGGSGGAVATLFLALVVFNVVVWIVIFVCAAALVCLVLGALLAGAGG